VRTLTLATLHRERLKQAQLELSNEMHDQALHDLVEAPATAGAGASGAPRRPDGGRARRAELLERLKVNRRPTDASRDEQKRTRTRTRRKQRVERRKKGREGEGEERRGPTADRGPTAERSVARRDAAGPRL